MNERVAFDKRRAAKAREWVAANYPAEWQIDGAPVLTERSDRMGSRHVPGYSPWGGFDLGVLIPEQDQAVAA